MADNTTHDQSAHDHDEHAASPCEEALAELYTFLDGELTDAKRHAISSHLESCNPCVEIFDFEAELRIVVSTKCVEQVPPSLMVRISEAIDSLAVADGPDSDDRAAF
jgi:mycothiol system anti-sigma-R factor